MVNSYQSYGSHICEFVIDEIKFTCAREKDGRIAMYTNRPITGAQYEQAKAQAEAVFRELDAALEQAIHSGLRYEI